MTRLRGMHAVVTGASRGLWRRPTAALAGAGARVTMVAETAAELETARARLAVEGADVAADCVDPRIVRPCWRSASAWPRGLTPPTLVNNAAVLPSRRWEPPPTRSGIARWP